MTSAIPLPEKWRPNENAVAELRGELPTLNIERAIRWFIRRHRGSEERLTLPNWSARWVGEMRAADKELMARKWADRTSGKLGRELVEEIEMFLESRSQS